MSIQLVAATRGPLQQCSVSAPDGAVIGIIGPDNSGQLELLQLACEQAPTAKLFGPNDDLRIQDETTICIFHAFALMDAVARAKALATIEQRRRNGATILIASHELEFLAAFADEIWWLSDGKLIEKGDSGEVLRHYRAAIARQLRAEVPNGELHPSLRRGDGRAKITGLAVLNAAAPTMHLISGEEASVRVTVQFQAPIDNPVVGIMIRTRIGFEVFGTNTELEGVSLGSCAAGESRTVTFHFPANLCPREYTLTAASHDPDGVWHDWLEDAVAFSVGDSRYTAGVANLHATVTVDA